MLPFAFLFLVLSALGLAFALHEQAPPTALVHAFFAAGALPLMFAAIQHFVPVLTRSSAPGRAVAALPWLAALAGLLAVGVFAGKLPRPTLLVAASLALVASLVQIGWIVGRIRRTLGSPHPGARWYPAALVFMALGMASVFGMLLDPENYLAWRRLHLHANLFGWIVLTALGTLPVLLPTVLKTPFPEAGVRLRKDLPWAAAGALGLALGAALAWPGLAAAGALALAGVPLRYLSGWRRAFGLARLRREVAASLVLAVVFLVVLLLSGSAHGFGVVPAERLAPAFAFGFLLPLITGALAQLLPVWRFSGPQTPMREAFRVGLARGAALRGALCVFAGALQLVGIAWAPWVAAAGLLAFAGAIVRHWRVRPQAPAAGL